MPTVPLMLRYKPNISPFTKYYHLKSNFYIDPFYIKVKSILRNKLSQVFTFGDFIFVAPMKSNSYVLIVLMDLCDDNGIPEESKYYNSREGSITGNMMQRIMGNSTS